MLDSLVRVSRRAGSNHFLSIPSVHGPRTRRHHTKPADTDEQSKQASNTIQHAPSRKGVHCEIPQSYPRHANMDITSTANCDLPPTLAYPAGTRTDAELRVLTARWRSGQTPGSGGRWSLTDTPGQARTTPKNEHASTLVWFASLSAISSTF